MSLPGFSPFQEHFVSFPPRQLVFRRHFFSNDKTNQQTFEYTCFKHKDQRCISSLGATSLFTKPANLSFLNLTD